MKDRFVIGGARGIPVEQLLSMSSRHGLIAGATGTGKTVTLQVLAENFSQMGVPVFAADIKGDLSGLGAAAAPHPRIDERLTKIALSSYAPRPSPVIFWDVYGEHGHPLRTTVTEMGPLLLGSLFALNETQESLLYAAFRIADEEGLLLLDLKDLQAMLSWMSDHARSLRTRYGNIAPQSIGAIQRRLLVLKEQGGDAFFGEPTVTLHDLMQIDFSGNGVVSLLDARRLFAQSPRVYSALLLWLLSELFEELPERGDTEKPVMVVFFDEAHLLFDQASRTLREKIEQVVRLIRSKGVGIYFVTQSPLDIPDDILGQLGLKVQHALRAFTPRDRKAIRAVAESFRENPEIETASVLTELGIGEALVSALDEKARPSPVQQALIRPPESRIGPLDAADRGHRIERSPLKGRYDEPLDRDSAYELLERRARESAERATQSSKTATASRHSGSGRRRQSVGEAMLTSAARSIGRQIGRQIVRGLLGSLFGKTR